MRRKSKKDLSEENKRLVEELRIRKKEYNEMKRRLTEETERLADLLSAKVDDCKIGAWCSECKYLKEDSSEIGSHYCDPVSGAWYYRDDSAGHVRYCRKHFEDFCPEYEPVTVE